MITDTINQVHVKGYQWETLNKIRKVLFQQKDFIIDKLIKYLKIQFFKAKSRKKALTLFFHFVK